MFCTNCREVDLEEEKAKNSRDSDELFRSSVRGCVAALANETDIERVVGHIVGLGLRPGFR
ncbi:hypothetical protein [Pseudodesulfovibrio sp.]|uniref:hypothetical protein n=1 Tax=Pseudodesulfovibrio sp. TaxID=2035812 RepID=UPI00263406C0|nr:hypothetical protein [Pseudodesulfovibrio sp.]MDD3310528.1 hypothetical protein [Pseudodesulfovibrio sp.]